MSGLHNNNMGTIKKNIYILHLNPCAVNVVQIYVKITDFFNQ